MTITEIREILESPYDRKVWKSFLQTQFTNNKLNAEDRNIILSDKTITKKCLSLGNYEINEFTKIGIFEIELNEKVNLSRNRVALRNLVKDISAQVAGAMVVFVQGDQWRFSYISKRKVKNAETNLIEKQETAPKRYTYLFGKGEKALTAAQRFDKLIQKQKENLYQFLNLEDFEEAFSVEKLGKEFFKNYKEIYEDFVEYITGVRYVKKGGKWTVTKVHEPHFDFKDIFKNDDKAVRDFFKRMLGRIVFLYFIQKKGWLAVEKGKEWDNGNSEYLYQLYKNAKFKELFYSDYLVPLFFETLNDPKSEDEDRDLRFPYLNGGLFDKSQDFQYDKLALPSSIFDKLFENFNIFNFTVYEDAPDEHTIAVDPEMLGHIFENLLEDNKDKGAFYTPKEIVHYMSKESLLAYLISKNNLEDDKNELAKSTLKKIINQEELNNEELKYAEKNAFKIIDDLKQVKICDPAIGSGAFPMGLLQEIFNIHIFLMELSGFTKKVSDADIKKHIIEESIYGVDIDPGAVDIARLRFWLSLVVDEPKPQPLPNLSFKIVCANTLIPLGKPKGDLGGTNEIADEIEKIREDYFDANKDNKKNLEREFRNLQNKLWTSSREWAAGEDAEIYKKISEFNPFEDKSCSWFDAWWMFGVKDGFDIVIGNPPYVSVKAISGENKRFYNSTYLTAKGRFNLFTIFLEKGHKLLNENGCLCFIQPDGLFSNTEYKYIRKYIYENAKVLQICLFNERVFDAAVDTAIILFRNNSETTDSRERVELSIDLIFKNKIELFFNDDETEFIFPVKYNEALQTINFNNTTKLFNIIEFQQGIIYSGTPKEEIFSNEIKNEKYKKCLDGRDVLKYQLRWDEKEENKFIEYDVNKLHRPREERLYLAEEKILIPRRATQIFGTIDTEQFYVLNTAYIGLLKDNTFNLSFILALLNSKLLNEIYKTIYFGWQITIPALNSFLIPKISYEMQLFFKMLVDYLMFLNDKEKFLILSHTENGRIASHIEDILNMMVYELYFEEHMKEKEVNLDVLQFISPKLEELKNKAMEDQIKDFYEWYQQPANPVRQRILLIDTRSPDILSIVNKSV